MELAKLGFEQLGPGARNLRNLLFCFIWSEKSPKTCMLVHRKKKFLVKTTLMTISLSDTTILVPSVVNISFQVLI